MFSPNSEGLTGEYLFDGVIITDADGCRHVLNTTSWTPPASRPAVGVRGDIRNNASYQLEFETNGDKPPGLPGQALDYDVVRKIAADGTTPRGDLAQYVNVPTFDDVEELTVEVWIKPEYINGPFPSLVPRPGTCPQPVCKSCS